jgi:hypothetical protein
VSSHFEGKPFLDRLEFPAIAWTGHAILLGIDESQLDSDFDQTRLVRPAHAIFHVLAAADIDNQFRSDRLAQRSTSES